MYFREFGLQPQKPNCRKLECFSILSLAELSSSSNRWPSHHTAISESYQLGIQSSEILFFKSQVNGVLRIMTMSILFVRQFLRNYENDINTDLETNCICWLAMKSLLKKQRCFFLYTGRKIIICRDGIEIISFIRQRYFTLLFGTILWGSKGN